LITGQRKEQANDGHQGSDGTSWRKEVAWPLPGTQWDRYYIDAADGAMSPAKGVAAAAEQSYPAMGDQL
jgi:uncharacterized protein